MSISDLKGDEDYRTVARLVQPRVMPNFHDPYPPEDTKKRVDPFMFGQRYLAQGDNVFDYNAWDHVEVDDDYKEYAELQYEKQRASPVSDFDRNRFNTDPAKWWNLFYKNNTANFFKNRKWLQQEFPILSEVTKADAGPKVVLEVGAGAGNSAFPILAENKNPQFKLHACDYSKKAVEVMRSCEQYDEKFMQADVWDVTAEGEGSLPPGLDESSVDVVVMVFIFSALSPNEWGRAISNVYRVLKPGGSVLFRDYGRGDLAQVRFKKGRYMAENFYVRGDGTRVFFSDIDELRDLWGRWSPTTGLSESGKSSDEMDGKGFEVANLELDRRLLINRQEKLKMHRCWIQGRFIKRAVGTSDSQPPLPAESEQDQIPN